MPTATTTALFLNETDGRICCAAHGGQYLSSRHAAHPDDAFYDTPLGTWVRWTAIDENHWRALTGAPAACECCGTGI